MSANKNLTKSKKYIDDEWYTRYEDIEKYLSNFKEELKGKNIYCPCDGEESNFVKYLKNNKQNIGYKNLYYSNDDFKDISNEISWMMADVIITNPPFSLKKDFYKLVKKNNCELIALLPDTLMTNSAFCDDLKNKKLIMDYTNKKFIRPNGTIKQASASWFNTFKKVWNKEWKYNGWPYVMTHDFKRYYNRCDNIDLNYDKEFYVPITFIKGSNINMFKILEIVNGVDVNGKKTFKVLKIIKKGNLNETF